MSRNFDPYLGESPDDDVSVADLGIVVAAILVLLGILLLCGWVGVALFRRAAL